MTPGFSAMGSPSSSPAQSPSMGSTQPTQGLPYHLSTFHLLHPVAAGVLQRVEAQSAVDVESYVRALGDKRYAVVKESRRTALLSRARQESGVAVLDDATVRRNTNLASAEASRAKKEFIMDELHSQLKKKTEDAVVLAQELRKMLLIVEQLGNTNRQMEAQMHQQRLPYGSFIMPQQHAQGHVATSMGQSVPDMTQRFVSFEARSDDDRQIIAPHHNMQANIGGEGNAQSEYSSMIEDGNFANHQAQTQDQNSAARTAPESHANFLHQNGAHPFDVSMEYNMKMEAMMCPPNVNNGGYEMDDAKFNALQSSLPSLQSAISESIALSVSNPNNQFTVAG